MTSLNRDLITAAPDLLAALCELHAAAEVMPSTNSEELLNLHMAVEKAAAVIAKAQGARAEAPQPDEPNARHIEPTEEMVEAAAAVIHLEIGSHRQYAEKLTRAALTAALTAALGARGEAAQPGHPTARQLKCTGA